MNSELRETVRRQWLARQNAALAPAPAPAPALEAAALEAPAPVPEPVVVHVEDEVLINQNATEVLGSSASVIAIQLRIAQALEKIADKLTAVVPAPSIAQEATSSATAVQIAEQPVTTVESVNHFGNVGTISNAEARINSSAIEVDEEGDPWKRCGVCHSPCSEDELFLLEPCGHYPYCRNCVASLQTNFANLPSFLRQSVGTTMKMRCPNCNEGALDFLKVQFSE